MKNWKRNQKFTALATPRSLSTKHIDVKRMLVKQLRGGDALKKFINKLFLRTMGSNYYIQVLLGMDVDLDTVMQTIGCG